MTEETKALAESQTAESLQAKAVAAEAEAKARKQEFEAGAEVVIERFIAQMKSNKTGISFDDVQRAEIKDIVHEALAEFFKSYGLKGKNAILTAAVIIGAIVVILGGFKSVLGWLGFAYIK